MRWIDIILPEPETDQEFDAQMAEAIYKVHDVLELQQKEGLDSPTLLRPMAAVGRILFQAVSRRRPTAFSPDARLSRGITIPTIGLAEHDDLVGFQVVTEGPWANLPWTWLHNGIEFLFRKHPICVADHSAALPPATAQRPWMARCQRAGFLVGDGGQSDLYHTLDQLHFQGEALPRILFVAGHSEPRTRRLIQREAEAIEGTMASQHLGCRLADIEFPTRSLTPAQVQQQSLNYQAIHFAGPTSIPAQMDDTQGQYWMNHLIEEINAPRDRDVENAMGVEGELVGVDPVTALLDTVGDKYDREGLGGGSRGHFATGNGVQPAREGTPWLLDDGPLEPESMSLAGGVPPLVVSNSHRALPELGPRFTDAGASTFVGPLVPIFSRPARIFASYLYRNLADGWCAGAAVWQAGRLIRQELGADHPAWLSYGLRGYGSLSLQYL
ncbi:hypothetical protein CSB20_11810 [bacterium DOLZORAL124_64_63]|nr:MAG: hypothetical protein CSB20_11810 [bacterium DOLZORAL124_64_63]